MTTSIPQLLGPIDIGSSFMVVSIQNNLPNILNGASYNNGIIYYWESNLSIILTGTKLPIFTASSNPSKTELPGDTVNVILKDTTNNNNVEFRSDGTTLGNGSQPSTLYFQQNTYSNWWTPDIFLSSVEYTISNSSGQTAGILTTPSGTGTTIPADNIIILPIIWYFNCSNNGTYNFINTPLNTLTNWVCLVDPTQSICSDKKIINSGWTNISDCMTGNNYNYCLENNLCGTNFCKGPCSVIYDDCNYKSSNYTCQFNPAKYLTDTKWWSTPLFIGSVIAIIIIIIVIIIVTIAVMRHGEKVSHNTPSDYKSYYIPG